jgi:hypothetical protein
VEQCDRAGSISTGAQHPGRLGCLDRSGSTARRICGGGGMVDSGPRIQSGKLRKNVSLGGMGTIHTRRWRAVYCV